MGRSGYGHQLFLVGSAYVHPENFMCFGGGAPLSSQEIRNRIKSDVFKYKSELLKNNSLLLSKESVGLSL
jgi:hypothetical protein